MHRCANNECITVFTNKKRLSNFEMQGKLPPKEKEAG
jgi:hypothetical protein